MIQAAPIRIVRLVSPGVPMNGCDYQHHRQRDNTYTMLVIFTVHADGDQHLHDQQGIRDEAQSWLESLDATVHGVNIRKAEAAS